MNQLLERIAPASTPFLRAEWRNLAVMSWPIDAALLAPRVPPGTELDLWKGQALVSVVGFRFLRTALLGVSVPGHRDFEEVNLRFYVRRRGPEGWRSGVVFVQEIVPLRAVAWAARTFYAERYVAWPMSHRLEPDPDGRVRRARYAWRRGEREERVEVAAPARPSPIREGTLESFVAERSWGYTALKDGTLEYRVEHPGWCIAPAEEAVLDCDAASLWGDEIGGAVLGRPLGAFLADGSPVAVYPGKRITE